MSKAFYMVLQKEMYMKEVPFLPCCLNFHTLATKSWSQVAGLRVGANRKRSEFGLFYCTVPAFAWRSWRKTQKA